MGVHMISQAWTMRQRQEAAALLRDMLAMRPDLSMAEAVEIIDGSVASASQAQGSVPPPPPEARAACGQATTRLLLCPHCGSPLVPVANPDGLRIIGCKRCRYSRILEGTDG